MRLPELPRLRSQVLQTLACSPFASVAVVLLLAGCTGPSNDVSGSLASGSIFIDRAAEVGLEFTHTHGGTGSLFFVETMGPGNAFLDYDNDGDLDVYLVQGHPLDSAERSDSSSPIAPGPTDRLFRNDLRPGDPESLSFTDVTEESAIRAAGYGMGVATGDFDNDGWTDLYVTNFGPNQLWRNNGDGTFSDVTQAARADDERWSTGASFFDFDGDGWLDLYVANYVDYRLASARPCKSWRGTPDYCGPLSYEAQVGKLLRNAGDGTFEDVSGPVGILTESVNGLGVAAADFDLDGRIDLYVASDQTQNLLWMNDGAGALRDLALASGAAVNRLGRAEAGMGVAAADFDNDGDPDLFVTHLTAETNTYYRNDGRAGFLDATAETGLASPSAPFTGFGVAAFDFDNDGWLDLAIANGAVKIEGGAVPEEGGNPYQQRDQLFRNLGEGRFEEIDPASSGMGPPAVGRGLVPGDVDNDGDADLLLSNNNGPVRLLLNQLDNERPWLGLRLVDRNGRDALGALLEARREGAATLRRSVHTDGSYCSARDPRILLGLGDGGPPDALRIRWPNGAIESFDPPTAGRYTEIVQGRGTPVGAS